MAPKVIAYVKVKIECLLKVKFIWTPKCVTWLSNIVSDIKKNGKLCVYIDFKNLNNAITKDEYIILVADVLVDLPTGNAILSFMDRHSGYN